jgi:hypothetical protein
MAPTTSISVIIGIALVGGAALTWAYVPRRKRLKRLDGRDDLSIDQIYTEFFAGNNLPKELACELWNEVATCLRLPPGKLRPTDRFERELAAPKGWEFDDDIVDIQFASNRRLKRSGVQADLSQIKTIGDYVEFFCKFPPRAQKG